MADSNPTIDQAGTASIKGGQYCTWKTKNGSPSQCVINNPNRDNILKFSVVGVPAGAPVIAQLNGQPVANPNGFFQIPPNQPNVVYQLQGDIQGANVVISNGTNSQADALCNINCVVFS